MCVEARFDLCLTCVALLPDLCEGPMAMLTLDEDCVSVVFPPSAADSPEITRPLEKLRFPNRRLRVEEDEETWRKRGRKTKPTGSKSKSRGLQVESFGTGV